MVCSWLCGLDFLADPYKEEHEQEKAEADEDIDEVCHGFDYLFSRLKGSSLEPK